MNRRRRDALPSRYRNILGGVALAFLAFFLAMPVAHAAEIMRVTFVRHAESTANANHIIDTTVPGPGLTPKGQQQAEALVGKLGDNNYDAIYASTMLRTQQTAVPMSQYLGLPIQVIDGIAEIPAGALEGKSQDQFGTAYIFAPLKWAGLLPNVPPDLTATQPGTNFNGNDFNAGVDNALKTMYDKGDRNPIVFSHGATIMFWTIMNVNNLSLAQKGMLLSQHALGNTDYVVIEGNPQDGWTLTDWNGQKFAPEPSFEHELGLQIRTLNRQLQQAANEVAASFASHNLATIATAINHGIADASFSVVKFNRAINAEVIKRVTKATTPNATDVQDKVSTGIETVKTALNASAKNVAEGIQSTPDTAPQTLTGATKLADPTPTTKTVKSKVKESLDDIVKPRGATDLSDGNKALPGAAKSLSRSGDPVRAAVKDAQDQVSSSIKKLGDAVKKAAGQTDKPADNHSDGAKGAA
ncbi:MULTISPECIES: histidine phosphatase family protein [unclassified Mycolicibacterium]|uniref:histidine phosphatase family protein n=1 Tax=unclassified Mycolicibacterium TaxID=2636767 RepID=UPI0012DD4E50|nr:MULTISPECIES: histidine phosphatase family protein [unclassified Mycolicibacterium]MUL84015.1 histidine phosphatase family protein [Mycolicibacterium sp. CBMA 329]MUL89919.1 histidine phosphatase family protein [Mycolicibacterium sp. CBMA 331]MUL98060.1 histidine phosphatase family protein [Mycolicibacterium sp. CBMA 334]MUM25822.1 histidine phosphatase family protein [Mycolicibacterium sp. CBMA 295]MUM39434.1 histidine phosphatase family protein [Mycolicibacterium sp. CBMA 247]